MVYLDTAIIAGELAGFVFSVRKNGLLGQFVYYTQCSNYILLVVSAVHLLCLLRRRPVPAAVNLWRYIAACLTTVTFLVTACVLIPWYGHPEYFLLQTNGLFQHLLCPVLAVAGLPFLRPVRKMDSLLAMIPTVIYGVLFYALNFFRIYDGPYPFMRVHQQPWHMSLLWFAVIAAVAYGTASALRRLCGKRKMPEI